MSRIGFVGLSTPSFYDYANEVSRAIADTASSPNPIVEGVFGAMLLYDELWFLSRSLCPGNMRGLPFVRFLDEEGEIPPVDPESLPSPTSTFEPTAIERFRRASDLYHKTKERAGVYWEAAADNHTNALRIDGRIIRGNSWHLPNVIYDLAVAEVLPYNVELITNSFTDLLLRTEDTTSGRLQLTEVLVLEGVPNFLNQLGPYHPCLEEVRGNGYLEEFRKWVVREGDRATPAEVAEIKESVERTLEEAQRDIFLRYLDPRGGYRAVADTVLSLGLDALVPGSSGIKDLVYQYRDEKQKQKMRWQGFIVSARSSVRGA